jgi:hypothetical protein
LNEISNYSSSNLKSNQEYLDENKKEHIYLKKIKFVPTIRHSLCVVREKNQDDYFHPIVNFEREFQVTNKSSSLKANNLNKDSQYKSSTSSIYTKNLDNTSMKLKKSKQFNPFDCSVSSISFSLSEIVKKKRSASVEEFPYSSMEAELLLLNQDYLEEPDTKQIKTQTSNNFISEIEINRLEPVKSNLVIELLKDEKILRHPALVKKCLESKSYDLIREQNKDENLNKRHTIYLDSFKAKTKINSYLNQKLNKRGESNLQSVTNVDRDLINFSENKDRLFSNHIYQQNKPKSIKKMFTRQTRNRNVSPPPPIKISPNGLLSPPPLPLVKKTRPLRFLLNDQSNSNLNVCFTNDPNEINQLKCVKNENKLDSNIYSAIQANKNFSKNKIFERNQNSVTYSFTKFSKIENNLSRAKAF